jgi:hypothetical protein
MKRQQFLSLLTKEARKLGKSFDVNMARGKAAIVWFTSMAASAL